MKLPYVGVPDYDEDEQHDLKWDPARGMYGQPESLDSQHAEGPSLLPPISYADRKPAEHQSDELEDLLSQLLVENSAALAETSTLQMPTAGVESAGKQSIPFQMSNPVLLVPEEKPPSLPRRPQSFVLPPRPNSSIGNYSTPTYQPARPEWLSYIPPPSPPQQPSQQQAASISIQSQYGPQQHYNPRQYSPSPLPAPSSYQPSRVQFPQYQYYPPPPPSPYQIPLPPPPARRPSPQPLQHQHSQLHTEQRQDSDSSISTVSSTSTFKSLASVSTVSAAETPLTGHPTSSNTLTPGFSYSYDPAIYDVSPKPAAAKLCSSPNSAATNMYFPPPPTGVVAGIGKKGTGRGYFG